MRCPACAFRDSAVYDSRPVRGQVPGVWRRRRCLKCDHRWTTWERDTIAIPDIVTVDLAINCLAEMLTAIDRHFDADDLAIDYPHLLRAARAARKLTKAVQLDSRQPNE